MGSIGIKCETVVQLWKLRW